MPVISPNPAWAKRLEHGTDLLGIHLATEVSEQLLRFLSLLFKWNQAYNLTAVRDPLEMVDRHLIDSLSILPYVQGERTLDMGTGPGLPGIPLALMMPESRFVLLDSNLKKIRFVRQVVLELGLHNVQPVHARLENLRPGQPFDTLVSRAFTSLPKMLEMTGHLLSPDTQLLAMKGIEPEDEMRMIPPYYAIRVIELTVPFAKGERRLIIVRQKRRS